MKVRGCRQRQSARCLPRPHSEAASVAKHEIDVVIVGPLTSVGFDKPGTIAETREFEALVVDVRLRARRSVAFVLIHRQRARTSSGVSSGER